LAFGSASYPINNLYHANQPIFFLAVFSKSYCPYCRATKELLSASGAQYYAVELDQIG
jgi:thiol-disulfide isomerase/thioredoxin